MTIYISNAVAHAASIDAVAEMVNAGTVEGMSEVGGTEFTPEMLAGQYAYSAALDAEYGLDEDTLDAHLDFLFDAGAEFDRSGALAHAHQIVAAERE